MPKFLKKLEKLKALAACIVALITLIGLVFGIYFYMENRYALAEELNKVKQRLDYKIKADQLKSVQDRIWVIEDRYQSRRMDPTTMEELRKLKESKESIKGELINMEKK